MQILEGKVEGADNVRFDKYITENAHGDLKVTRSQLKTRFVSLEVNGKAAKLSRPMKDGDVFKLVLEDEATTDIVAEDLPLEVLFENDDVWVISKAQGMVTHPAHGNWNGTLANALLSRMDSASMPPRAGIVHRLDKDTSGIIIAAKHARAQEFLAEQFRKRRTEKFYIAIVQGVPTIRQGRIETWLARDSLNRKRFAVSDEGVGKKALSEYRVLAAGGSGSAPVSLLLFKILTGRTHQIRVHCRHLGCPILGDPIYGRQKREEARYSLMLHAYYLTIQLPGEEAPRAFTAPVPERFLSCALFPASALGHETILAAIASWPSF